MGHVNRLFTILYIKILILSQIFYNLSINMEISEGFKQLKLPFSYGLVSR